MDEDVVVVDRLSKGHPRLAILCHGLEGSSDSSYMKSMATLLYKDNYDVLCLNFRSCGGVMNKQLRMYHSGETSDLHMVIKYYQNAYQYINLIGFSLGGNVILKYLGENPKQVHHKVRSAVAVSVPIDLSSSAKKIGHRGNYIYQEVFLKSLAKKTRAKAKQFPDDIDIKDLGKVKSLYDFDDYFTSRIHGFKNAEDYYSKSNASQFLFDIEIPTLLINAKDDPFLTESCFPEDLARHSNQLYLHTPKYGGHVGFYRFGKMDYHEEQALTFFNQHASETIQIEGWNM